MFPSTGQARPGDTCLVILAFGRPEDQMFKITLGSLGREFEEGGKKGEEGRERERKGRAERGAGNA